MEWEGLEGGETRGSVRNVLAPTGVVGFLFFLLEVLEVFVLEVFVLEVFVLEVDVDGSRSVRPGRRPSLLFVDRLEDSVVVPIRFDWVGLVGCSRTWSIRTLVILEVVGAVFLVFDCKRCCLSAVFWAEDTTALPLLLLPPSSSRFECFVAVSAYIFDINALHSKSSWVCAATGSGMACRCLVRRRSLAFSSLVLEAGLDHDGFSPR